MSAKVAALPLLLCTQPPPSSRAVDENASDSTEQHNADVQRLRQHLHEAFPGGLVELKQRLSRPELSKILIQYTKIWRAFCLLERGEMDKQYRRHQVTQERQLQNALRTYEWLHALFTRSLDGSSVFVRTWTQQYEADIETVRSHLDADAEYQSEGSQSLLYIVSAESENDGPAVQVHEIQSRIQQLQSGSDMDQRVAISALRDCAANCNANRVEIAAQGAIPLLIGCLKTEEASALVRQYAACALGNLAYKNIVNRAQIVAHDGITALLTLLKESEAQPEYAAYALGNLASETGECSINPETKSSVLEQLVELLFSGRSLQRVFAAFAIGNLMFNIKIRCVESIRLGSISVLSDMLWNGTPLANTYATHALGRIASTDALNRTLVFHRNVTAVLLEMLEEGTSLQKQHAAIAIAHLAQGNQHHASQIASMGAIPLLVSLLVRGNDIQKQNAAHALGNLAINEENRISIAQADGIGPLVSLLCGSDGQRRFAATALAQLACNEANREAVALKDAIEPLISMFKSNDKRLKKCAARALGNMAINRRNRSQIATKQVVAHLVELLKYASEGLRDYIAFVLGLLSCGQPADRFVVALASLVGLGTSGTDLQREFAAFALGQSLN